MARHNSSLKIITPFSNRLDFKKWCVGKTGFLERVRTTSHYACLGQPGAAAQPSAFRRAAHMSFTPRQNVFDPVPLVVA
jgi:hypothetical protein